MSRMSIDQNAIRQSVYAYANNLAALAESSSGKLPPFLVTLTASTGYAVADALDYDTEQSCRNGSVKIVISDVEQTYADIDEAKQTANPILRRALNSFRNSIRTRVANLGDEVAETFAAPYLAILDGSAPLPANSNTGFARHDITSLISFYNSTIRYKENRSSLRFEYCNSNRVEARVDNFNYVFARVTPRYEQTGEGIELRNNVEFFPYNSGTLGNAHSILRSNSDVSPLVSIDNGTFGGNPIRSMDEVKMSIVSVLDLSASLIRAEVLAELERRFALLEPVCGTITASFADGSVKVFNATESSVA